MMVWMISLLVGLLVAVGAVFWQACLRPYRARPGLGLQIETRTVVEDSWHNGFTDLVCWNDTFFLVYIASPSHFASSRSAVVVLTSTDGAEWRKCAKLGGQGKDIRDPKLVVIGAELFLFALLNESIDPRPCGTVLARSTDGNNWTPFVEIESRGWLFGRPKTEDGQNWYVSAHWRGFDKAALFHSLDGVRWDQTALFIERVGVDETALEFREPGEMQVVIRFEPVGGVLGSAADSTLLLTASLPYTRWPQAAQSALTRLDSPNLFRVGAHLLAVGRSQPRVRGPFLFNGSVLSQKRTAVFRVDGGQLVHLLELPSCGDTAYAGTAVRDGKLFISYYSSSLGTDLPWILGMIGPTQIRLAVIDLAALERLLSLGGAL